MTSLGYWWNSLFLSPKKFLQNYHLSPQDRPFRLFRSVYFRTQPLLKYLKLYLNGSTCVKSQILWILRRPNCKDQNRHPSVPSCPSLSIVSVSLQAEVFLVKAKTKIEVFSAYWESSYSHFLDLDPTTAIITKNKTHIQGDATSWIVATMSRNSSKQPVHFNMTSIGIIQDEDHS